MINKIMKITIEQFKKIEKYLPKQHGNVKINNYEFVNILLYVPENGCKWRALPKEFGNWHTIDLFDNLEKENSICNNISG